MYCQKCGKENPKDARFCMHCRADLSGYRVEISPKIVVSPKIEIRPSLSAKPTPSAEMCAICGKSKAVAVCKECDRAVCANHLEDNAECTFCNISWWTKDLNTEIGRLKNDRRELIECQGHKGKFWNKQAKWHKEQVEWAEGYVEDVEKKIEELKRKL